MPICAICKNFAALFGSVGCLAMPKLELCSVTHGANAEPSLRTYPLGWGWDVCAWNGVRRKLLLPQKQNMAVIRGMSRAPPPPPPTASRRPAMMYAWCANEFHRNMSKVLRWQWYVALNRLRLPNMCEQESNESSASRVVLRKATFDSTQTHTHMLARLGGTGV